MLATHLKALVIAVLFVSWCCPNKAEAHRQYDPGLRRFAQRDPGIASMRESETAASSAGPAVAPYVAATEYIDGLSSYTYTQSNPLYFVDPQGLDSISYCSICIGGSRGCFLGCQWGTVPPGAPAPGSIWWATCPIAGCF